MGPGAKIQDDSLRTEHTFRFLLANNLPLAQSSCIEYLLKIHIKNNIRKLLAHFLRDRFLIPSAVDLGQDLEEQGVAVLLVSGRGHQAVFHCRRIQIIFIDSVLLNRIAHHRSGREFVNSVPL